MIKIRSSLLVGYCENNILNFINQQKIEQRNQKKVVQIPTTKVVFVLSFVPPGLLLFTWRTFQGQYQNRLRSRTFAFHFQPEKKSCQRSSLRTKVPGQDITVYETWH